MKDGFIKVAAASPVISLADTEANAFVISETIEEAYEAGVRIIVFPELTVTGYTLKSGESWAYKVTTGTAATVLPGEVVSGWTAWDGDDDITAATGKKITVAVTDANGYALAAGSTTVTAKA